MRTLLDVERRAILALASELKSEVERSQLLTDLDNCSVEERIPDGSRLAFHISGYSRPPGHKQNMYRAKDGFRVEGSVKDADGAEMDLLLFADQNNRVYELEIVTHLPDPVVKVDWSTFKVK